MNDVLRELRYLEKSEFFTDRDGRLDEYQVYLDCYYDESFTDNEKQITRYYRTGSINFSDKPYVTVIPFDINPVVECYDEREKCTWLLMKEEILRQGPGKESLVIEILVKDVGRIALAVEKMELTEELRFAQLAIVAKLQNLKDRILVLQPESFISSGNGDKLKWLGKTNLLATLFYDLWKGQDKGDGKKKAPLIECRSKKRMMQFISQNFVDRDGQEMSDGTLSDYFNSSVDKQYKRLPAGYRIEIPDK